ncbi:MAG: hypothetical protein LUB59_05900 [Candidatus Gastranaerophilales bacterium]|nr:hypothetical protein [Candidatus Gastranaerophilales bacterium]
MNDFEFAGKLEFSVLDYSGEQNTTITSKVVRLFVVICVLIALTGQVAAYLSSIEWQRVCGAGGNQFPLPLPQAEQTQSAKIRFLDYSGLL